MSDVQNHTHTHTHARAHTCTHTHSDTRTRTHTRAHISAHPAPFIQVSITGFMATCTTIFPSQVRVLRTGILVKQY